MRRTLIAVLLLVAAMASPAWAGGAWMNDTKPSYEPGDHVHAVGYVGATVAPDDGPYIARLNLIPIGPATRQPDPIWLELGPVRTERTVLRGYLSTRVSLEFDLPKGLEPGHYEVIVQDPDGRWLGDLIGISLAVGIQPASPLYVEWPLDEPRIAELPDDAVIAGPGFEVVVADLRRGRLPAGAAEFMLNPDEPVNPSSTTVATAAPTPVPQTLPEAADNSSANTPRSVPQTPPEAADDSPATAASTLVATTTPAGTGAPAPPPASEPPANPQNVLGTASLVVVIAAGLLLGAVSWAVLHRRRRPLLPTDRAAELDDRPEPAPQSDAAGDVRELVPSGGG